MWEAKQCNDCTKYTVDSAQRTVEPLWVEGWCLGFCSQSVTFLSSLLWNLHFVLRVDSVYCTGLLLVGSVHGSILFLVLSMRCMHFVLKLCSSYVTSSAANPFTLHYKDSQEKQQEVCCTLVLGKCALCCICTNPFTAASDRKCCSTFRCSDMDRHNTREAGAGVWSTLVFGKCVAVTLLIHSFLKRTVLQWKYFAKTSL